jgi:succinate dehydrogenase/fumarate reductase flavoprotein subunit
MITGRRAGDSAARYALSQSQPKVNEKQVERFRRHVYEPLNRRQGVTSDEMRLEITKNWVNVDIRNEIRLRRAHENFQNLRKTSSQLVAKDLQELAKCHKIENYLDCSDAIAVAADARRETRLEHIREDYPLTDNREWLKWVIVRLDGDELRPQLEEIPVNRWKYRPEPRVVNRLQLKEEV